MNAERELWKVTEVCIQASKILGTRNLPWPVCNFSSNSFCCLQKRQLVPSIQSDLSGRKETVNKLLIGLNCLKICPAGKTSYIYENSNETRDVLGDPRLTWAEIKKSGPHSEAIKMQYSLIYVEISDYELRRVWRMSKLKNKIWHSGHYSHFCVALKDKQTR